MSIAYYHGNASSQHRYRNNQQQASKEYGPGEQLYIGEEVEQRECRDRQYRGYKVYAPE